MRFISNDEKDVSLSVLESALKLKDALYLIDRDDESDSAGALTYDGLFANRKGLQQAGGEGYYDSSGLILETE